MKVIEQFNDFVKNEKAEVDDSVMKLVVAFLLIALVFLPIGYKTIATVNQTSMGIVAGSTEATIVGTLGLLGLVVIVMGIIRLVKGASN